MVKIFVGNLASSTTVEELRNLFTQYGKITECDIVKNFGFVHMNNMSEAEEAIRNLHHYELNGERMNVEMSKGRPKSTTKLHVSNLGEGSTNEELKGKFEEFGAVVECDIVKDYAFVHMERMEDAMAAIDKLDNTAFKGKLMNVQLSTSRLRTAPGMGDQTGCYVCGRQGHWSKDCPDGRNGAHSDGARGHGGPPPPPEAPRVTAGGAMGCPGPRDPSTCPALRIVKYRARPPYGSSYFEDRRLSYHPPPPPPSSSLSRISSSVDPYDRRPIPPTSYAAAAAAYYSRDRSPIRRVPVTSASYVYERSRLSPTSASRSSSYARPFAAAAKRK
ncbi:hypothetical protein CRUP_010765 [Coryphaenoides rupestris]|nr:hypothetical protein CRUP_010765 [Coryphaenoides rupestris]